jgi:hypothetical protein
VRRAAFPRRQPRLPHRPGRHKATRSPDATHKAGRRRTPAREPCHTITSLFDELENRTGNTIRVNGTEATFPKLSTPTELQARALELIDERVPQIM